MKITDPKAYWRDILGIIDDLLPEWQAQPCECSVNGPQCRRCQVVNAATRFKYLVKDA